MSAQTITILGLTPLDKHELGSEFDDHPIEFHDPEVDPDRAHDPATLLAVGTVALGAYAIKAVSFWLMKRRVKDSATFEFEYTDEEGRTVRRKAEVKFSSSESPPADVITQVGAALGASPLTRTYVRGVLRYMLGDANLTNLQDVTGLRRSVAMLPPKLEALSREDSLHVLDSLIALLRAEDLGRKYRP